jgi:hypothetical protein
VNSKNELVVPSYFTDNYITLLPDDEKQIQLDFTANKDSFLKDGLRLVTEGWNVLSGEIKL